MPIATRGAVKNLTPNELKELGARIILSNTYHLWLRPGLEAIKKAGDLHRFMNWFGPILTDSGGFQIFSLRNLRKITDEGVVFKSEIDGQRYFLTPEKAIEIQLILGSDILMVLDECTPWPCGREEAEKAVDRTLLWAEKCKRFFQVKMGRKKKRPLLFGIAQGSVFKDLREKCVRGLLAIGFDGYAIGGMAPRRQTFEILDWVLPLLPEDKPRYLMGVGRPEEIARAVEKGIDMFDCVIPTREARHGRLYKFKKTGPITGSASFYETLQITNARFAKDFSPIDKNCGCYACQHYSRAYLRHLFATKEVLGSRLATLHNLYFYLNLMRRLRVKG